MLGFGIGLYWKVTWALVLPIGLTLIFIYAMIDYEPMKTANGNVYPAAALGIERFCRNQHVVRNLKYLAQLVDGPFRPSPSPKFQLGALQLFRMNLEIPG